MGVAVAAAYGSRLLNSSDLGKVSLELVNRLNDSGRLRSERDLLNGDAGMIAGLLFQARLLKTDSLLKEAAGLGENLIKNGERRNGGRDCSWSSGKKQKHPNLTGLSHGASGIALALFQLYGATGRSEFRDLALEGVHYERGLFDSGKGNWPDLRYVRKSANQLSDQHQFPIFWCHGAPGIAISRLAGWRHSRDIECLDEARLAFRSTYDWCSRALEQDQAAGCLCHGLAGNAMILLYSQEFGHDEEPVRYMDLARSVAGSVAYKVLLRQRLFGDAIRDIDNPSLMLGLAGLGHYLLHSVSARSGKFISPLWLE
jgi:lantibiotic modifying enzyme